MIGLAVNDGPEIPVLVDTGSEGLVIPIWDLDLQGLGWPTGIGIGSYSGGLDYVFLEYTATVDFGDGLTTEPTNIDALLFTYPDSLADLFTHAASINELLAGTADGILGIGPNPTDALPGHLGDGVLIDQPGGELVFGPNPLEAFAAVDGAPITEPQVQIGDGPLQPVNADIDSGGVYGTMPTSMLGNAAAGDIGDTVAPGTHITVYTADGVPLYDYLTGQNFAAGSPTIVDPGQVMNTGNLPFQYGPIYIDSTGTGATVFDLPTGR